MKQSRAQEEASKGRQEDGRPEVVGKREGEVIVERVREGEVIVDRVREGEVRVERGSKRGAGKREKVEGGYEKM